MRRRPGLPGLSRRGHHPGSKARAVLLSTAYFLAEGDTALVRRIEDDPAPYLR